MSGYLAMVSARERASFMPLVTVNANATIARRKRKLSAKPRNARYRSA